MSDARDMVRAVLLQIVPGRCRRDCGESGRPLCSAHDALAALDRVAGEERERAARAASCGCGVDTCPREIAATAIRSLR